MSGIGDSTLPIVTPAAGQPASIAQLAEALATAQSQIKGAAKSVINPFFNKKYADLAGIWEVVREPLSKNGLSVIQMPGWDVTSGRVVLTTQLLHTSGESISSTLSLRPKEDTPQAIGSAITYARRYALAAMVGAYQEDDDGEDATARPENEQQPPKKTTTPPVEHKPATATKDTRPSEQPTQKDIEDAEHRKHVVDALEEATGIAPAPPDQPPAGLPTTEERKEFIGRLKVYSRGVLPKLGVANGSDALKAFIVKTTQQKDVKLLTKTQWATILDLLDKAQAAGNLKELVS